MSKPDKALKLIKRFQGTDYDEKGGHRFVQVPLYLDPRGASEFVIPLRPEVTGALGIDSELRATTADKVKGDYARTMREYGQWLKTAKAEPVIIVKLEYLGTDADDKVISDDDSHRLFNTSKWDMQRYVGVGYRLAFRVNGQVHTRDVHHDFDTGAETVSVGMRESWNRGEVLDYTPELHATLDAVIATLNQAAQVLDTVAQSKDMSQSLLGIGAKLLAWPK